MEFFQFICYNFWMKNSQNEFLSKMKTILKDEFDEFEKSLSLPSVKSLYVNQNKIDVEKFKKIIDFNLEQIPYEKAGFYIENQKYGRHPLHHAGAFYLQEPSAMFTVNAYNFKGDEKVLDMCASPGGKSIQIANRLSSGVLLSNEIVHARSQILFSNIERMGLKNVIITNERPEKLAKAFANSFDVCLVDAPCSGEGMFRKGDDVINHWNANLPTMCAKRQKEILLSADKCLKQFGKLIYSTCTYSIEENEDVVNWLISSLGYSLVEINCNLPRGIDMPNAVRLYPHKVKGEGQFVAVLQKNSENEENSSQNLKLTIDKTAQNFVNSVLTKNYNIYEYNNKSYYVADMSLIKKDVNYISLGVQVGENIKNRFEPFHNFFSSFASDFKLTLNFDYNDINIKKYLRGETLDVDLPDGYGVINASNCSLGGFKISKGMFKNLYPKGLRNF